MHYVIADGAVIQITDFDLTGFLNQTCIYEVLRIMDGVPLFWEDHVNRLQESLFGISTYSDEDVGKISADVRLFFEVNDVRVGSLNIFLWKEENRRIIFWSEGRYPNDVQYERGVRCSTMRIERINPNIKTSNSLVREMADKLLLANDIYEVFLLNKDNKFTEGSRSNLFFLKDNSVYSASGQYVLKGITREYVIRAIRDSGLVFIEEMVSETDAIRKDAVFLTGTSPKILPVNEINGVIYSTGQDKLNEIMQRYNAMLMDYIRKNRHLWKVES